MENRKNALNARNIALIGLLSALTVVLGITPLGFIPIGPTSATTMHIPTMVGGILFGPVVGGFVGLLFGLFSMFKAMTNPSPVSFVFYNPVVAVLPRVLIGIFSYYVFSLLNKSKIKKLAVPIAAGVGTFTNTLGVLGSIYLLYGERYVTALGLPADSARKVIMGVGVANGIPECILAIVIVTAVVSAYRKKYKI